MTIGRVDPARSGIVILLNGPSSSGKTTLAGALRPLLSSPYQHIQLNAFRDMEPPGYWDGWQARDEQEVALRFAALHRAMHAAVAEYSRHGLGVIFDTVLNHPDSLPYALKDLAGLPVLVIGVSCDKEELARRELARGDRQVGLATSQLEAIHVGKTYDFEVDTTSRSAVRCASELAHWLHGRPVPKAFDAMRAVFDESA